MEYYDARYVYSSGHTTNSSVPWVSALQPVIYLDFKITVKDTGTGKIDDPYIIE